MTRRLSAAVLAALSLLATVPATAGAHAVLESTSPERGAALERPPKRIVLRFDEAVESAFGAVRVFDAAGGRVDEGGVERPSAAEVAVALRDDLPDGAYTATYRVVSADSHPVSGGFVFTVGKAGGTPATAVADLVDRGSGGVTATAFSMVRALGYAATALVVGGLAFLLLVWPSGGAAVSTVFERRLRALLVGAALAGALTTLAGLVLQGATAGGTTFWSALDPRVLDDVLDTRFGVAWAARFVAFALVAGVVLVSGMRRAALLALPAAALVVAPALAGHARAADDAALLVPLDALHVAAMSVWIGGVAVLVAAVPTATRALDPPDRTQLLATVVRRFSTAALASVAVLLATGVLQSIAQLEALGDLVDSAFGRAILVKVALLLGLIGLGAHNRRRSQPRLLERAAAGEVPGATGRVLKRVLLAELATMAAVLVASGALVGYSPAGAADGPFVAARDVGSARVELTVGPAEAGRNEVHLYLFDRRTGAQFDGVRRLTLTASESERDIGPIDLGARKAGPGHYTVPDAQLAPAGTWEIELRGRVSAFEELRTSIEVPVR